VPRDKIQTASENLADSQPYKATRSRPLLQLLRKLQLPRESNFVDIGAGKGRVVLIAAQYGFRKVVGVEFSAALCAIARENVKSFSAKKSGLSPMEIVEADATLHHLNADDCILFMYNPFHEGVMKKFMDNVQRSLQENPRKLWLIYNDPLHHPVISKSGIFREHHEYWVGGTEFRVYATSASLENDPS